jgi:toxin CcdB
MARYDYYRIKGMEGYVLDCQSDLINGFKSRVVVPLTPENKQFEPFGRLHPVFEIGGAQHYMATHLMSVVPLRELGTKLGDLKRYDREISAAIDMLFIGF